MAGTNRSTARQSHRAPLGAEPVITRDAVPAFQRSAAPLWRRPMAIAATLLLLVLAAGTWWWLRPAPVAPHSMEVRLAGFQVLSADLPAIIRETVDAEIAAAFNADGVVGVSNAPGPAPGAAPAYALGGTIRRDGHTIRVITRLTNERSGATLWTNNFNYDGNEVSKVPRHIAVDAGNVVRCGLFGASTYRKALLDAVLTDYLQFCQGHWDPHLGDGRKALVPAQRVVAAAPDFSWGWAAVAGAYWKVALSADDPRLAKEARAKGRQATDRALAIDGKNSEAMWIKSLLIDRQDWTGRERLLKRAIAAMRLDCGCEHHQYGDMLLKVGRTADAVEQLRQANDMLALYVYTPLSLAQALVVAGKTQRGEDVRSMRRSTLLRIRALRKRSRCGRPPKPVDMMPEPRPCLTPSYRCRRSFGPVCWRVIAQWHPKMPERRRKPSAPLVHYPKISRKMPSPSCSQSSARRTKLSRLRHD